MTPNPHALVARGGFQTSRGGYGGPRRGGGRSSGGGRGIQQSWCRGGGNHHVNRQQQQQHPRSPSKPLTASFGLGGPFNGGTNAGGWPQEESPPSPNGSVPHCERCGRKGHMTRICRAPLRFEGTCGMCGQYGHRMRYCIRNQPATHAHVVAAPIAPPAPSACFSRGCHRRRCASTRRCLRSRLSTKTLRRENRRHDVGRRRLYVMTAWW